MEAHMKNESEAKTVKSVIPKTKQEVVKWNGWGYANTEFVVKGDKIVIVGDRYDLGDNKDQSFPRWSQQTLNLDLNNKQNPLPMPSVFPEPIECKEFLEKLEKNEVSFSQKGEDRITRCHGQLMTEILSLRLGKIKRIPDLVIWPTCHDQVVKIVELANKHNVMLLPFGGGTNVTQSTFCPEHEKRPIAVLDTTQMNRMLWIDKKGLLACFESGVVGQDLERVLEKEGMTMGHEPDSHEFSTLGGWIATRASGMKKNEYGNIEDIVVNVKMVTSKGVLGKNYIAPRVSCGPDFEHIILGSEGTLGVITEVIFKIRPLPELQRFESVIFPSFSKGVDCFRELAKQRIQPASIRLIDNTQTIVGIKASLTTNWLSHQISRLKINVMTKVFGYKIDEISVCTILLEGTKDDVNDKLRRAKKVISQHGGILTGQAQGEKGYRMIFAAVYVRDFVLNYGGMSDSMETSCPWDKVMSLIKNVIDCAQTYFTKHNIPHHFAVYRVSQIYDEGCCIYFYFGIKPNVGTNGIEHFHNLEDEVKDTMIRSGGSISHHHGIGKVKTKWYRSSVSDVGAQLYKSAKLELDPKNIFGLENILTTEDLKDVERRRQEMRSKL